MTVLPFNRRRGRPKSPRRGRDCGTPELARKRSKGETAESLDLCLERGIITMEQHWCGIHLRWLYTLRHGAPGVRAVDPTHLGGIEITLDDPEWRGAREKEYHDVMNELNRNGLATALANLCIHNERPPFLSPKASWTSQRNIAGVADLSDIRNGLDILVKWWGRQLPGNGRKK